VPGPRLVADPLLPAPLLILTRLLLGPPPFTILRAHRHRRSTRGHPSCDPTHHSAAIILRPVSRGGPVVTNNGAGDTPLDEIRAWGLRHIGNDSSSRHVADLAGWRYSVTRARGHQRRTPKRRQAIAYAQVRHDGLRRRHPSHPAPSPRDINPDLPVIGFYTVVRGRARRARPQLPSTRWTRTPGRPGPLERVPTMIIASANFERQVPATLVPQAVR